MEAQTLITALTAADSARPRSQQTAIGVSALGGCRRKVWHQLNGDIGTNPTSKLAAILGTAIHASIEEAFKDDPDAMLETRVEIDGYPPATIDYYNPKTKEVVDWKTITLKNVDYFVSKQKRWQIQTYAFLLTKAGYEVDTVTLVGIPRDGTEADIIVYSEQYDETVASEAFAWLEDIKNHDEAPSPGKDVSFCKRFCEFYGSFCTGITPDLSGEAITDETAAAAASDYVRLSDEIKTLEKHRDNAKAALEGVAGVTMDGIKVSWTDIAGRSTIDADAVKTLLGDEVPMKQGAGYSRLTVK